ncbi:hypothetical protein ABB02_00422 [Clostridiaceae bacterium JG1575]|nr:hypothetical protein ABB02_00422 [Clostridiaceae bacterium JG1575]
MDRLALFDVDYTLTRVETQVALLKHLIRKDPKLLRFLPLSVLGGLGWTLRLLDERQAKQLNLYMLRGYSQEALDQLGRQFFHQGIKPSLYLDGLQTLSRHHREGYRVILLSASPEFYIRFFELSPLVEKAMGSRFEVKNDIFTGQMEGKNNKGAEKMRRLMDYLGEDAIDWGGSVAYSDSLSDRPILEATGTAFLINHRRHKDFPVLTWT